MGRPRLNWYKETVEDYWPLIPEHFKRLNGMTYSFTNAFDNAKEVHRKLVLEWAANGFDLSNGILEAYKARTASPETEEEMAGRNGTFMWIS